MKRIDRVLFRTINTNSAWKKQHTKIKELILVIVYVKLAHIAWYSRMNS